MKISQGTRDFWKNFKSLCLLNPKLPVKERRFIEKAVDQYKGENQIWLKSSGTESSKFQGEIKMICLPKEGILKAADSVNKFYGLTSEDIWLNPLPLFHIGGFSVGARCFLAGARELRFGNWQALDFYRVLKETKTSITSLVPTQVFDLVETGFRCPPNLRLVLVGGGGLRSDLYKKACSLGWPLAPVYGMTETSALIAGASLVDLKSENLPQMELLSHVRLYIRGDKPVVESKSLFDSYLWIFHNKPPFLEKRPDPFVLDDRLELNGRYLRVLARSSELVKVFGETVNLVKLSHRIGKKIKRNCVVIGQPHQRLGSKLCLFIEAKRNLWDLEEINEGLMAFERVKVVHCLDSFPRNVMGKLLKFELVKTLDFQNQRESFL